MIVCPVSTGLSPEGNRLKLVAALSPVLVLWNLLHHFVGALSELDHKRAPGTLQDTSFECVAMSGGTGRLSRGQIEKIPRVHRANRRLCTVLGATGVATSPHCARVAVSGGWRAEAKRGLASQLSVGNAVHCRQASALGSTLARSALRKLQSCGHAVAGDERCGRGVCEQEQAEGRF